MRPSPAARRQLLDAVPQACIQAAQSHDARVSRGQGSTQLSTRTSQVDKISHIAESCSPSALLSTRAYLLAKALNASMLARAELARWPALPEHATDTLEPPPASEVRALHSLVAEAREGVAFLQFT